MENNKQQTAVDSLKDFFKQYDLAHSSLDYYEFKIPMHIFDLKFQETKEMEKQRIETAYNKGTVHGIDYPESTLPITGEQYYEQTYGGGEQ
jgi:hypothetical protein